MEGSGDTMPLTIRDAQGESRMSDSMVGKHGAVQDLGTVIERGHHQQHVEGSCIMFRLYWQRYGETRTTPTQMDEPGTLVVPVPQCFVLHPKVHSDFLDICVLQAYSPT